MDIEYDLYADAHTHTIRYTRGRREKEGTKQTSVIGPPPHPVWPSDERGEDPREE